MEEELKKETEKWLDKIEDVDIDTSDHDSSDLFEKNIEAYISDSKHFLGENELIKAFEAVVWAWSWYEIGEELGILKE